MAKTIARSFVLFVIGITLLLPTINASRDNTMFSDQVAVLMYHHVHDTDQSSGTITTKLFEEQLTYLRQKGYRFISLDEFLSFMQGGSVPNNAVLVTFDDGYESFYTNAYPILKRLNIPAVNFIITETFDNPGIGYVPFMTREQVRTLTNERPHFISAQCHTHALHHKPGMPYLTNKLTVDGTLETDEQYRRRIIRDTQECIRQLEPLGPEKIESLAYPYGAFDKLSAQLVQEGGIRYAFTIVPEMATRNVDPLQIPRINAGSPYITPQSLHNTILRRVVAVHHPFGDVPIRRTIEQLGGTCTKNKEGKLDVNYNGKRMTARPNSNEVEKDGRTIRLKKPIYTKANVNYIALEDLETMLETHIVYNPNTKRFQARVTPDREK